MFIDWTYIILVLPAILFSLWASYKVNSTFRRYSSLSCSSHLSGYDIARKILDGNGLSHIRIERISGHLSDHYDPRHDVVRLSDSVYDSTSMAAIGVAAHECGHAIQHAKRYFPMKIRNLIVPLTNIGSKLSIPLVLIGILLSFVGQAFIYVAYFGVACFSLCALFQLITLPVEFNASRRALSIIKNCGMFSREEVRASRKVLSAAALTYVAALTVTFAQLLRLLLIVSRHDRRN